MDINGILVSESALNVNGKRSRDTSDLLETNEVQTKRIRIGTEPDTYYLPDEEGKSGQTIVADGIGGSNWETTESAGNSILENLLLDPLTGGNLLTIIPSITTSNSWLINPPSGVDPWTVLTGDYTNGPPHAWLPPSAAGRCIVYFETTLPTIVNTFETNFQLKLWGDVGGRISGDETSIDNDVYCWIQKASEDPPEADDTVFQLQEKEVHFLRKLEPRAGQAWGHEHFLTSAELYKVNIDPAQWNGAAVRIGLGFNNAGPSTMIPPEIFPPGARFRSIQLFSQFPGSGAIATLPEQIDHDVLINSGNIIDHATIDAYINQPLTTTSDVEFKSVNVTDWQLQQDAAGDFELLTPQSKLVFGGHSQNVPSTLCAFASYNGGGAGGFRSFRSRGTLTVPTNVLDGDVLDVRRTFAHDGAVYYNCGSIRTNAVGSHTAANSGTSIALELTPNGTKSLNDYYLFKTNEFQLGLTNSGYILPTTRGYVGQVLKLGEDGETMGWDTVGKYQQLQSGFADNTALETSLTDQNAALAKGNLIFPAGVVKPGDSIHIRVSGAFHSESKDEEVTLRIFAIDENNVKHVLHSTGLIDLDEIKIAETPYEWEVDLVIRDVNTTSTVYANSQLSYSKEFNAGGGKLWNSNSFSTTMNLLTLDNTLDISAQWNAASSLNTFRADMITVTKTF